MLVKQFLNNIDEGFKYIFNVKETDEVEGIKDASEFVDAEGVLPIIKENTSEEIYDFININLTNEFNRKLYMRLGFVNIDDFMGDRRELKEMLHEDKALKNVTDSINFNTKYKKKTLYEESKKELIKNLKSLDINNAVIYPYLVYTVNIPDALIVKNNLLQRGYVLSITKENERFKTISRYFPKESLKETDYEVILITDKERMYILSKNIYKFYTIKKFMLDDFYPREKIKFFS